MTIHAPELLWEILFRLPAKSIGRFRCVCKSWKSLLSQPSLIKTHLSRIKQHPIQQQSLLLVCSKFLHSVNLESAHQVFDEMMTPTTTMLTFANFERLYSAILASCDGLIVVVDVHNNLIMLVNPTTREIKALPQPPCELDHHLRQNFTIPGIGYDSLNDDYKVVTISFSCDDDDFDMLVNVFSVKSGTWKTVGESSSSFDHKPVQAAGGVYCNGHIHWIAKRHSGYSIVIMAFDIKEEKFRLVPHPCSVYNVEFLCGSLLVVQGCLCLSPYWMDPDEHKCFVMKEYGVKESWTKITVHVRSGIRPLCLLGEEQMVLLMREPGSDDKLALYNVKERASKEIKIQRFPDDLVFKETFVESLLSPHFVYRDETANEE